MAALEKIRKRAVILTIVIGAGLLAFILEEAVRASSSFFNDTTAATVGDEKIEIQEFQNRLTELNQANQNNPDKQDPAIQQQQLLQQMVFEKILEKEYEKAGITVSNEEMMRIRMLFKSPSRWHSRCRAGRIFSRPRSSTSSSRANLTSMFRSSGPGTTSRSKSTTIVAPRSWPS